MAMRKETVIEILQVMGTKAHVRWGGREKEQRGSRRRGGGLGGRGKRRGNGGMRGNVGGYSVS